MKKNEGLRLADAYLKGLGLEGVAVPPAQTGCAADRVESPASSSGDSAREVVRPVCAICGSPPSVGVDSLLCPGVRSLCGKCAESEYQRSTRAVLAAIEKYGPDALQKLTQKQLIEEFGQC